MESACPTCGLDPVGFPGPEYSGRSRSLWRTTVFAERLCRCAEGHLYSIRVEWRRRTSTTIAEPQESVDDWVRLRTGLEPHTRPPGL